MPATNSYRDAQALEKLGIDLVLQLKRRDGVLPPPER
jgi:hypothetical protein